MGTITYRRWLPSNELRRGSSKPGNGCVYDPDRDHDLYVLCPQFDSLQRIGCFVDADIFGERRGKLHLAKENKVSTVGGGVRTECISSEGQVTPHCQKCRSLVARRLTAPSCTSITRGDIVLNSEVGLQMAQGMQ